MDTMTWGPIEPVESSTSRLRLDFGLRSAILRFNEWAVPGLGGAFFVRQLSWGCMGLLLARELDGKASASRIAEGLEALACWIVVKNSKAGRVEDNRVQGKRKFLNIAALSFDEVFHGGTYVTVPFRRATTRSLPGLGFCQEEARFNALILTRPGLELAESAMASAGARKQISEWLKSGTTKIQRESEALKRSLLPELATDAERKLVHKQVLAHEGRRTIGALLHQIPYEQLAGSGGRELFLDGLPEKVMRRRLATCFAFEDLRAAILSAAQHLSNEIQAGPVAADILAVRPGTPEMFSTVERNAAALRALLAEDAPPEAAALCAEQDAGAPLSTRILSLCSRAPIIFSVIGDRIDQGIGYTRDLDDDPGLPIPRPIVRLQKLLTEAGEIFDYAI